METAANEESCWLQNMKRKVLIIFLIKRKNPSMRAQQTSEAIFRKVYSKGRMCVSARSLIALPRIIFFHNFFCFGVSSQVKKPAFPAFLKGRGGRSEIMAFFLPFLNKFLFYHYLPANCLHALYSTQKTRLHHSVF